MPLLSLDEIYDLFIDLDADEDQLDFPVIYASGRSGWGVKDLEDERKDLTPLLDSIIENIPQPIFDSGTTQMQVTTLDYSDYVGRIGIGRVFRGILNKNNPLSIIKRNGSIHKVNIKQLFVFEGLERKEIDEVHYHLSEATRSKKSKTSLMTFVSLPSDIDDTFRCTLILCFLHASIK